MFAARDHARALKGNAQTLTTIAATLSPAAHPLKNPTPPPGINGQPLDFDCVRFNEA